VGTDPLQAVLSIQFRQKLSSQKMLVEGVRKQEMKKDMGKEDRERKMKQECNQSSAKQTEIAGTQPC
jgi:hypothetical protein